MSEIAQDVLSGWDVLVIDDDFHSLTIAATILKHYGATVYQARDGKEGLKQARAVGPRFIISDLSMPEMDGWEFIGVLKKDRALQDIPAIALTAHAMPGDRTRAIAAGFHNYLTKPLTPATFMSDLLLLLEDIPEISQYLSSPQ